MTRTTKSLIAAVVVALVVAGAVGAVLLTGRGGGSTTSNAQAPAQSGRRPANSAAFQQFRQCMTNNGVTLSAGQRPNPSDPTFQKARQACAQYAPQGGFGRPGGGGLGGGPPAQSGTT